MRIISRRPLREFAEKHADAERALNAWYRIVKAKQYTSPHELKADFATVSFLGARRTVFNIGGGKYRLIVDVRYDPGIVFVREVLTHDDYDERSRLGTL